MSALKGELLVNGYIRGIQKHLIIDTIIPLEIISLCLLFWTKPLKFISINQAKNTFSIFDIEKRQQMLIIRLPSLMYVTSEKICYIGNISKLLSTSTMDKTKQYDAIIFAGSNGYVRNNVSSILMCCIFEATAINDKDIVEVSCEVIQLAKQPSWICHQLLY